MNSFLKKIYQTHYSAYDFPRLSKAFNVFMWIYVVFRIIEAAPTIKDRASTFNSWHIGEFLVNFQGGFVRRGFIGELLFHFYNFTHVDPRYIIIPLCILAFGCVLYILIKQFNKYKIWWWILASPFFLSYIEFNLIRKDFFIILIIFLSLKTYALNKFTPFIKVLHITILHSFMLFIHEASFFMIVPFFYLLFYRDNKITLPLKSIYLLVTIAIMWLFFLYTGSEETALAIHNSWRNAMPGKMPEEMCTTIKSIGWSTSYAFDFNGSVFTYAFRDPAIYSGTDKLIYIASFFFFCIPFGIYLLSRYVYLGRKSEKALFPINKSLFTSIIVIQFISLFPLFAGLSCDFTRLFLYLYVTSFFIATILSPSTLAATISQPFVKIVDKVNSLIDKAIPCNIITLWLFLILIGSFTREPLSLLKAPINVVFKGFKWLISLL